MCVFDFAETKLSCLACVTPKAPVEISSDDARPGDTSQNTLYVSVSDWPAPFLGTRWS
jgi:hypothetical protein